MWQPGVVSLLLSNCAVQEGWQLAPADDHPTIRSEDLRWSL